MVIAIPNLECEGDVLHTPVAKKNVASISGTKKNSETNRLVANTLNPFDALKTIKNDDDSGANGGPGSVKGKNKKSDLADKESESDVEEVYNETANFRAS
ncbi:hypothetical protein Tco_1032522 [Tanacetum coccineum]|uniref:Uncharacterized protein n=1 Tax=Tanacetum coccineum TaxID=301880 RepID=A0ABQ5GCI8_9ASTR